MDDAHSSHIDTSISRSESLSTLRPISLTGLFGGDSAVAAMGTVHLFAHRWICGWYNTPGSFEIAKRYGQLANIWFWDGLFPGGTHEPSELFKLNGQKGPPFLGAHSGSKFPHTGHLAYLLARKARYMQYTFPQGEPSDHLIGDARNRTIPKSITIFDLRAARLPEGKDLSSYLRTGRPVYMSLLVLLFNLLLSILSWSGGDGLCAFIICLGIAANGFACLVLGWGTLAFHAHVPAEGVPPGDGVLYNDDGVLILLGGEPVVSSILRGRFFVRYSQWPTLPFQCPPFIKEGWEAIVRRYSPNRTPRRPLWEVNGDNGNTPLMSDQNPLAATLTIEEGPTVDALPDSFSTAGRNPESPQQGATRRRALERPSSFLVACCSFLLMGQFITQLLIIPLGTPSGQVLYILSLAASWVYNAYLASHDREDIQTEILLKMLRVEDDRICKIRCDFRTPMAVFTALVLQAHARAADPTPPTAPVTLAPPGISSSSTPASDAVVPSCNFLPYADVHLKAHPRRLPDPTKVLSGILPNDTEVWRTWKADVAAAIRSRQRADEVSVWNPQNISGDSSIHAASTGARAAAKTNSSSVNEEESQSLLPRKLYGYADEGQNLYLEWLKWCRRFQ